MTCTINVRANVKLFRVRDNCIILVISRFVSFFCVTILIVLTYAVLGVMENSGKDKFGSGFHLMMSGTVPMSAGLSSSSALVCASALMAAKYFNNSTLTRESLAELCAKSERYVGLQGGGMDQAISFLGVTGKAQLINFNPIF